jgi:phosphonate ABC transporter permease subunit PhnE
MEKKASLPRSIRNGIYFTLAMLAIAYAFQVTKVNLNEFRQESRQTSRARVARALARPDIFKFDQEVTTVNAPLYLPCPAGGAPQTTTDQSGPSISLPACAALGETIRVEGFNFPAGAFGPIGFVPGNDPEYTLLLIKGEFEADSRGHFSVDIALPKDRASDDVQFIRVIARRNLGWPHFSANALATWDKIIETVFMAFLATLLGTILSFPISFLAARNLMKDVKSTLTGIAFSILGWPIGIAIGYLLATWLTTVSDRIGTSGWINLIGAAISFIVATIGLRVVFLQMAEETISRRRRALQQIMILLSVILIFFGALEFGSLGIRVGNALIEPLGALGFIGNFIKQFSDILRTLVPMLAALIGGGMFSGALSRLGLHINERWSAGMVRAVNVVLGAIAGILLFVLIGLALEWLYEISDTTYTRAIPAIVGGTLGALLALLTRPKRPLAIGLVIYTVTRTILNAVRSIEALVMAIVFVIWVGIGPFAGVLALGLHTVVSLAKLYSEQVESIMAGPLEAIEATGANRLQTIIYAVIPQIIPPYISYTMYRWDINVRMSTIIGFVGGGGIGFLLLQNINLLDYNAAATQMVAIAIVVASMDYISSNLREKFV